MPFHTYILRSQATGRFYVGHTENLNKRLAEHHSNRTPSTKNRGPWELFDSVAPQGEDIVITRHRIGAFAGTDLDMILQAKEIETLILFGIATSGVVLTTLLHAVDADYRLIVVKDCCANADSEVHHCLVEKVFPRLASVMTAGEVIDAIG